MIIFALVFEKPLWSDARVVEEARLESGKTGSGVRIPLTPLVKRAGNQVKIDCLLFFM